MLYLHFLFEGTKEICAFENAGVCLCLSCKLKEVSEL
jgi:hypothetical protein